MPTPPTPNCRIPSWLIGGPAVAGVLCLFYAALFFSVREKSATFDEPGHATAGYTYWKFNDYRIDPENGNLAQRWIGLPYLIAPFRNPEPAWPGWQMASSWRLSDAWFNRAGNNPQAMLWWGRAFSGLLAVALGWVVWRWSRDLFGPLGGAISLVLYVSCPAVLANGALMTSDMPAALFLVLSCWCVSRVLAALTLTRVLCSALAISALFTSKASAAIILPVAILAALLRILAKRPVRTGRGRSLVTRGEKALGFSAAAAVHILIGLAVIWALYGFRFSAFASERSEGARFARPWEWALEKPGPFALLQRLHLPPAQAQMSRDFLVQSGVLEDDWSYAALDAVRSLRPRLSSSQAEALDTALTERPTKLVPTIIDWLRRHSIAPEAFLYGYANVWKFSTHGERSFLNGKVSEDGWYTFFPYLFLIKTPLPFFGMCLLALAAMARRYAVIMRRANATAGPLIGRSAWPVVTLWLLLAFYWLAALSSKINLGHRHILVTYPVLAILCGSAGQWFVGPKAAGFATRFRRHFAMAVTILLIGVIVESTLRFPNYLAYFNGIVRPSEAYKHVIDSSLDWGQDLPAAARYVSLQPRDKTYLAFFGVSSPSAYNIMARQIYGYPGADWTSKPPLLVLESVKPGDRQLAAMLRQHPDYDPDTVLSVTVGGGVGTLVLQRASALRLTGGTFLISASLLQPVYYHKAAGAWNPTYEAAYQRLRSMVAPLLGGDAGSRAKALLTRPVAEWLTAFYDFDEYQFARLTAYLRQRAPDDNLGYSILVYRLSDRDVQLALDGPPP